VPVSGLLFEPTEGLTFASSRWLNQEPAKNAPHRSNSIREAYRYFFIKYQP